LEDLNVEGRIILKWIFEKLNRVCKLDSAQDRFQWLVLVNTVTNFRVITKNHKKQTRR